MGCTTSSAATNLASLPQGLAETFASYEIFVKENKAKLPVLGMLMLDQKSGKREMGGFDHPGSFSYQIKQQVVKGLTLEVCHAGKLTPDLEKSFVASISALEAAGASVICGDTGFMMWFQSLARKSTKLPVILSSLAVLPSITCSYGAHEKIAVLTADSQLLKPMATLIHDECSVDINDQRFVFVGCEDIPGFHQISSGQHDDAAKMEAGLVAKATKVLEEHPQVRAFLLESTELPRYAKALRKATFRPVFDALNLCDFYIASHLDNPRFGVKDWDDAKQGKRPEFNFGQLVSGATEIVKPVLDTLKVTDIAMQIYETSKQAAVSMMVRSQRAGITLGVIRLDYHYPPAPGDVDHPGSYPYEVHYHMVKGLTFEMCQAGKLTPEVETAFLQGIKDLEAKGVSVITGDCGFMMWLQELARRNTKLPVIMSSLATLPAITASYTRDEQVAIFTANGQSLLGMEQLIKAECGVDVKDKRYIFVGCEEVPGFEAVALGQKVDVRKVTPGIVKKAQEILTKHPQVRAILMECTELPPYSDAMRHVCGVPVFDAITACDFYIASHVEHPMMKTWSHAPLN